MRSIHFGNAALMFCSVLLLFVSGHLVAQSPTSEAPIAWERYKVSGSGISEVFPKLPTRIKTEYPCDEMTSNSFYAFANNAVYELSVISKNPNSINPFCRESRRFGDKTLEERLKAIRKEHPKTRETISTLRGRNVSKFVDWLGSRWIISDMKSHRWIELAISKRSDAAAEEDKFIGSLDFGNTEGKEIGNGSDVMLGDPGIPVEVNPSQGTDNKTESDPMIILAKPKAVYTDRARDHNVQGTVRLNVTFLGSGGIGTISPVTGLPDGLTEQAISSAKKLVFLPKRVNSMPVSVERLVEYSFTIY